MGDYIQHLVIVPILLGYELKLRTFEGTFPPLKLCIIAAICECFSSWEFKSVMWMSFSLISFSYFSIRTDDDVT